MYRGTSLWLWVVQGVVWIVVVATILRLALAPAHGTKEPL